MKDYSVPIRSLIDHINAATDVDPWAKEMAADLLGCLYEKERRTKVEFIESYIKIGDGEYQWNDNHGELIRCKECRCWDRLSDSSPERGTCTRWHMLHWGNWFCGDGKRREKP